MPADSSAAEKYVVYASEDLDDDSSEKSGSIVLHDPAFIDLGARKLSPVSMTACASPVLSTTTTDKWSPYWSKRERRCCVFNFLLMVSVAVMVAIVVLVSQGVLILRQPKTNQSGSNEKLTYGGDTTPGPVLCQTPPPPPPVCVDYSCSKVTSDILSRMNVSADPCLDFYTYACGGFMEQTKVSWTSPRLRTNPDVILSRHLDTLAEILADEISESDPPSLVGMKRIFRSCMLHADTELAQVADIVDSLGGLDFPTSDSNKDMSFTELLTTVVKKYGASPLFKVMVRTDGQVAVFNRFSDALAREMYETEAFHRYRFLRPSDYFYRDEAKDEVLLAYKDYIGEFFGFVMALNSTMRQRREFQAMINDVYHLEIYINRVLYTEDTTNLSDGISRCERQMTVRDIQHRYHYNMSWSNFLTSILGNTALLNYSVCYVDLNAGLLDVLSGFSYQSIKRYIVYSTLVQSDIFHILPRATPVFLKVQWSHGALSSSALRNSARSESGCVKVASNYIPMATVIRHRTPELFDNKPLETLFSQLVSSLEAIIDDMYWVPSEQKQHLLRAFDAISLGTATKDEPSTKLALTMLLNVTDNFFQNMLLLMEYRNILYLKGKDWQDLSATSASILKITNNHIDLPVTAMRSPLYYHSRYPSAFYGSIGTLLAQALSENFDIDALMRLLTQGKIDHRVALTIAYRIQCLVDEYSRYVLLTDTSGQLQQVRGDLTKSENFKDSLALRVAYKAYVSRSNMEGPLTPLKLGYKLTEDQIFFIAYSQTMCEKTSVKGLYQHYINTDTVHQTYGKYRILGTLSNFRKFADAFQCPVGSPMNPENKCSLF